VRATVLNGFLAYCFYGGALIFDIGRPWNAMNPFIGNNFGYASVLFLICWHFMLYMVAAFIEFSPVIAEWLNLEKARRFLKSLTLATVILGVTLSLLHQSGLGALFRIPPAAKNSSPILTKPGRTSIHLCRPNPSRFSGRRRPPVPVMPLSSWPWKVALKSLNGLQL